MASVEPLKPLDDDGLPTPEIGAWGEEKYRHVQLYASLFIKSMRSKWNSLVYLDLFAGSGRSQIRGTGRIVNASPVLILGIPEAYHKYVFCERNTDLAAALETRCKRDFPNRNVNVSIRLSLICQGPAGTRKFWGFVFWIRITCRTSIFQQYGPSRKDLWIFWY